MNNKIAIWGFMLLMVLITWGCDKKWPINGNLDGYWQLMTVETKSDGVKRNNGYKNFFGELNYDEDKNIVAIKNLKEKVSTSDNGQMADIKDLNHYGINSQETVFDVIKADGKTLILESDYARLTMRSF